MNVPSNTDFSGILESSFAQMEKNLPVKLEPVCTITEIKDEDKNSSSTAVYEVDKTKIYEKIENDYVFNEHVINEGSSGYCTQNLMESKQDPLAVTDSDLQVNKEFEFVEIKQELITEVQEGFTHKYEDIEHKIDMEESKKDDINIDLRDKIFSIIGGSGVSGRGREILKTSEHNDVINSPTSFKQGMKMVHKRDTNNKCYECHKTFSSAGHLRGHFNSEHKGKTSHECSECKKKFSRYTSLVRHINSVHKGIKSSKCNECHKMFSSAGHLKVHMNGVHKGIKNYQCKDCLQMFFQAGHLKVHIESVHKGIKNHKCNECERSFSRYPDLKSHINSVHKGIRKFKCNECPKMFVRARGLKKHIDREHKRDEQKIMTCLIVPSYPNYHQNM